MISDGDSDSECKAIYETSSIPISNVSFQTTRALKRKSSSITRGVHLGDQDNVVISKHSHVSFRKTKDKIDHNNFEQINEESKKFEKKKTFHKIVSNMAAGNIDYGHHEGFDLNSYVPKSKTQLLPTTTTTLIENKRNAVNPQRVDNGLELTSTISINLHQNLVSNSSMTYTPSNNIDFMINTNLQQQQQQQQQQKSINKSLIDKNLHNQSQNNQEVNGNINVHNNKSSVIDHPAHWSSGRVPKLTKNRNSSMANGKSINSFTTSSFSKMKSSIIKGTGKATTTTTTTTTTSVLSSPSTNKKRKVSNSSTATQSTSTASSRLSFQPSWLATPKPTSSVINPICEVLSEPYEDIMNCYDNNEPPLPLPLTSINTPLLFQTIPKSPSTTISSHILPIQGLPNQTNQLGAITDSFPTNYHLITSSSSPQPSRSNTVNSPISSTEKRIGYQFQSRSKYSKHNNKHNRQLNYLFQKISKSVDMDENRIASIGIFAAASINSHSHHLLDDIRDKAKHWIDVTITDIKPASKQQPAFIVTTIYLHQMTVAKQQYMEEGNRVKEESFHKGGGGVSSSRSNGGGGGQSSSLLGNLPIDTNDKVFDHREENDEMATTVPPTAPTSRNDEEEKEEENENARRGMIPGYATAYFKSHLVQGQTALAVGLQLRIYDTILLLPCSKVKMINMGKCNNNNWDNSLPVLICTNLCEAYPSNAPTLIKPIR